MDWLEFISSSEWPAVAVVALVMLRQPLQRLIGTLRSVSYKDFKVDFGERLKKAEAEAAQLAPQPPALAPPDPTAEQRFRAVADVSPNAAVLQAWVDVVLALRDLAA